jgi:PPOX class probable F420-dependent enzyme
MARSIATNTTVELAELLAFTRSRHRMLLATSRRDGRPQISPVSGGVDLQGRIVISTYPARAKTRNAERDPRVSVLVLSDDWNGPWAQVDGDAEVLHMPEAADGLVDYFRCISGEHPDWEEYREAMRIEDKSLIRITPTRWGPIATGGFPADVAARLDAELL